MDILYMVIPCYNEEEVLGETSRRLTDKFQALLAAEKISPQSRVLYVDDGSRDGTWEIILRQHRENPMFQGLKLSRNKGHQNALLAGLMLAKEHADMVISMDADLQDDIGAIDAFIDRYYNGCEIVYGVRNRRDTDTFFKRTSASMFYKFMRFLGVDIIDNHADYRLMSKRALDELANFQEVNLFLRGIIPLLGFKTDIVYYERQERFAGTSKYPFKKMMSFAFDGITSFSVRPIKFITGLGILIAAVSIIVLVYTLFVKIFGFTVPGWTATIGSIWLIGGINLLCLGIIGEYIGKIYKEVKARPKYIVETDTLHPEGRHHRAAAPSDSIADSSERDRSASSEQTENASQQNRRKRRK
ncbi:glycosyltransferase family 2 protein [Candidatus Soleaferrea massiliensis]|uniref:glycosyltransferase family 2 protein n=1 Tax=Candidatus Soleaferrea massiliensis TaxID=1470354 RepID=UPI0009E47DB4|nr:glycosyltransferase family 2 protein [Candidatus Soleaferrea massiliensis]